MRVELYNTDICYAYITMENGEEQRNKLMKMFQDKGITIQKYYWISKLDNTHIELFDPKIFDIFDFQLDVIGDEKTILDVLSEYKKIEKEYKHLDKCLYSPLTEQEIKTVAMDVLSLAHQ